MRSRRSGSQDAQDLLRLTYDDMEARAGEALSAGMSDDLLDEFAGLVDRDVEKAREWVAKHRPDYETDPIYLALANAQPAEQPDALLCEYAATAWLEVNRPDYREVVQRVSTEIRAELVQHRDMILRVIAGGEP